MVGPSAAAQLESPTECLSSVPYPCGTPEGLGLEREPLEAYTTQLSTWIEGGLLAGAELLVIKDGQIVWHTALGKSDLENGRPLERHSIYRIRSMTKPFVAMAALQLVEAGQLSLDDRVAKHLRSFDNARSGAITVRDLLGHASGFEQTDFPSGYWEAEDLREAIKLVGAAGPPNPVGDAFRYSDWNTATLGAIVAELTGEPVEEVIRSKILVPLGLVDTHMQFAPDSTWANRMNSTHVWDDDGGLRRYWDSSQDQSSPWFRASGGMYSTVFDYARWLEVWMNGGRIGETVLLSPATVTTVLTPVLSPQYGLHMRVMPRPGDDTSAPPPFGHSGSDGTWAMAFPSQNAVVLVFTQSRGTPASGFIPFGFPALLGIR